MDNKFKANLSKISAIKWKIVIPVVAAILIVAFVIAGFITDWFGIYGPVTKISLSAVKTIQQQNFSADFNINDGTIRIEGTLQLHIDPDKETVQAYLEATSEHTTYILAIYESNLIYGTQNHLYSKDISQQLTNYFAQRKNKKPANINSIDDALDLVFDLIPEQFQSQINERYLDLTVTKKLIKSFVLKKLNRTAWLKKNAGYSTYTVDGIRYYSFQSNNGKFLREVAEHFEEAFVNKSLFKQLVQHAQTAEETNTVTKTLVAVEDGYLVKFETVEEAPGETTYTTIEFYDIGTTNVDTDRLQTLAEQAKTK